MAGGNDDVLDLWLAGQSAGSLDHSRVVDQDRVADRPNGLPYQPRSRGRFGRELRGTLRDDKIYQGSGGGSGMGAWTRPDARKVQFRLYYEVNSELFTDGLLHQHEVPADDSIH